MGAFLKRELTSITNWLGAAIIALGETLPYVTPDVLADLGFTAPWVKRISTVIGLLLIAYREKPKNRCSTASDRGGNPLPFTQPIGDKTMSKFSISALASNLIAVAKADAAKDILPLIDKLTSSIASNPSTVNVVAQASAFQVGVLAALPGLEQAELVALAGAVDTEAKALLAPSTTAAAS